MKSVFNKCVLLPDEYLSDSCFLIQNMTTFECMADWGKCICAVCPSATTIITSGTSSVVCVWELSLVKDKVKRLSLRQVRDLLKKFNKKQKISFCLRTGRENMLQWNRRAEKGDSHQYNMKTCSQVRSWLYALYLYLIAMYYACVLVGSFFLLLLFLFALTAFPKLMMIKRNSDNKAAPVFTYTAREVWTPKTPCERSWWRRTLGRNLDTSLSIWIQKLLHEVEMDPYKYIVCDLTVHNHLMFVDLELVSGHPVVI